MSTFAKAAAKADPLRPGQCTASRVVDAAANSSSPTNSTSPKCMSASSTRSVASTPKPGRSATKTAPGSRVRKIAMGSRRSNITCSTTRPVPASMRTAPLEQMAKPAQISSSRRNGRVAGESRPVHSTKCVPDPTTARTAARVAELIVSCASGLVSDALCKVPSMSRATICGRPEAKITAASLASLTHDAAPPGTVSSSHSPGEPAASSVKRRIFVRPPPEPGCHLWICANVNFDVR